MNIRTIFISLIFFSYILIPRCCFTVEPVRHSILAGTWYSSSATQLKRDIDGYLANAKRTEIEGKVRALIVPHAGYRYSGQAAAYGYKLLQNNIGIKRVIILAPSHHWGFRGASIADVKYYETPLGKVKLDIPACSILRTNELVHYIPQAHIQEHSIEIQLPFLQDVLTGFSIVPILIGQIDASDYRSLAITINKIVDEQTIVIVSSDFTHFGKRFGYLPFYSNVRSNLYKLDHGAISLIIRKNFLGFQKYRKKTGITICGADPIGVLLNMLPPIVIGKELTYYTSGDLTGNYINSVSYVSIVFYAKDTQ